MYCFAQCSKSKYDFEEEDEERDTYSCMIANDEGLFIKQPSEIEFNDMWAFNKFKELAIRDHKDETPNYRFYLILE